MSRYIKDGIFYESLFDDLSCEKQLGFKAKNLLYDDNSAYQEILIFDSLNHGRILALDGTIQITEADEFTYHEMLAFVPLSCHPNAKKVFIAGGGDGGMACQVVKFPTVQNVTVCDIDKEVVEKCREFFPRLAESFDHPKCNLVIDDAFDYLRKCEPGYFDVVICDSTDPEGESGISNRLFGDEFYSHVHRALAPNGIVCAQTANNMWQCPSMIKELLTICKTIYPIVGVSFVSVPSFACGQNGFLVCSKDSNQNLSEPFWTFDDKSLDAMNMNFYDTDLHRSCFNLPRFVKKALLDHGQEESGAKYTKDIRDNGTQTLDKLDAQTADVVRKQENGPL